MVEPKTSETLEFLRLYCGDSPIVLTGIVPNGGTVESETFRPVTDSVACAKWLDERQGIFNLYFTVNPTIRAMSGRVKAKKEHIRGMVALHVDVDPRPGEDLEDERTRALAMLSEFNPPPTFLIDSGGGYQGFWKLKEEQPINGDEDAAAEFEAYNQQFCVVMGADNCWNIDRIMRLPGTLNVPDAKKIKKGRKLALASLVEHDPSRVYDLSQFTAAPRIQSGSKEVRASGGVKISGNLARVDLDTLDKIPAKLKTIIVQGEDPDDLNKWPSRSEVLFYVCCELIRLGIDTDVIASLITDREMGIAASVVEKPRSLEYAARQIQRAKEQVESPELREMNDAHAVIADMGGKCRVITEVADPMLGRTRLSRQSFEDFRNRYLHRVVIEGKKRDPLGNWWLKHPRRRQYETIVFAPGKEVHDAYNLWRGFSCEAVPGDCSLFLKHVQENICCNDPVKFEYLMNWMARTVQRPDKAGEVAIVLRGKMGTGKGKFVKIFGSLLGRHFLQVTDPKHLVGNFNAHLRDCVVLFADEAFYAGDKKHESILKALVTEETLIVEGKGADAEVAQNCTHMMMASNSQWVVPAGTNERRFLVLDVSEKHMQDINYFVAIDAEMNNGGREALLYTLTKRDITKFVVQDFPRTEALVEQQQLSWSEENHWWFEKLMEGMLFEGGQEWLTEVSKSVLQSDYETYAIKRRAMKPMSPTALGKFLARVMPLGYPKSYQKYVERVVSNVEETSVQKVREYFYELPSLKECRDTWDKEMGVVNWPENDPSTKNIGKDML
ncbi:MAG: hypothetical protein JWN75_1218 [Candidatus Saccharibacteria bacterium]|nr:hypothetical protein [Candidatus Saccharibacteria bacterium]